MSQPADLNSNLRDLCELAALVEDHPELVELIANERPEEYDTVNRLIASPFFGWTPFGKVGEVSYGPYTGDNTCQAGWLLDGHRSKWAICGNRSGKSVTGTIEDWADMMGIHPIFKTPSDKFEGPVRMWVVSDTEETSINVVERLFVDQILGRDESGMMWNFIDDECRYTDKSGWSDHVMRTTQGSECGFKFSTQRRNTFQGVSLHKIRHDEVQPMDIYGECMARIADTNGYFTGTMTPIYDRAKGRGIPWIYEELYLKRHEKKLSFHSWSMMDNPHIPEDAKRRLMEHWDEDEIEARVYGSFVPIGVKLALPQSLMREIRLKLSTPVEGQLWMDEEGEVKYEGMAA